MSPKYFSAYTFFVATLCNLVQTLSSVSHVSQDRFLTGQFGESYPAMYLSYYKATQIISLRNLSDYKFCAKAVNDQQLLSR